jgi:hypothetical protein
VSRRRCRLSPDVTERCVVGLDIEVRGRVRGLEEGGFHAAARAALAFSRKAFAMRSDINTGLGVSLARAGEPD